jgi:predicted DCC family thiol-disulfide oxidoreductase YuxK
VQGANASGGSAQADGPLVLFDGVCNLCSALVTFVIDRDPGAVFRFASLQSAAGQAALRAHGRVTEPGEQRVQGAPDTVVLIEDGHVYERSTAALRVARRLRGPWPALYALVVVPRPLRDAVYRWIARHRYAWFGRTETCRVPTPELRSRFLDDPR